MNRKIDTGKTLIVNGTIMRGTYRDISMGYSDIVATIAMIVSISAVPASGYLSYRYAIKGEKRKEWNSITEPLLSSREEINAFWNDEQDVHLNHMPTENIERLRRRMNNYERQTFDYLWRKLDEAITQIKKSPAPFMFSNEPWASPYPNGVDVTGK